MNEYPISPIIPTLTSEGYVIIPVSGMIKGEFMKIEVKLSLDEAKELGERLEKIFENN